MPRSGAGTDTRDAKVCTICGRTIQWRKKWERDWANVRYCSSACRSQKLTDTDFALEAAILELLRSRAASSSICPSEAAKKVDTTQWQGLMEAARMAARRLVEQGLVEVTQQGHVVDPSTAKGPVRVRLCVRMI
jgi:hypothetical protein